MLSLEEIRKRAMEAPHRVRALATLARSSGMMWDIRLGGLREVLRALGKTHQNPSTLYAIHAGAHPDRPAVIWRDVTRTYAELDDRMGRLGQGLCARGLGRGQSVLLMTRNRPEFIEASAGVARVGAAAVAVSWRSTAKEVEYLANNCGARFVVFEHDLWPTIEQALPRLPVGKDRLISVGGDVPGCLRYEDVLASHPRVAVEGDDEAAAVVTYTSGTTGKPKGAVRRFPRELLVSMAEFVAETPMRVDDMHLVVCPLYHMTAWGFMTFTHAIGATAVIADEFKPETFLELVEKHSITTTALVPTMLHRLVSLGPEAIARHRTRSLRAIFCGGAALTGQLAAEAMDLFGDVVFNFYGATETGLVTLGKPADLRAAPGTIGRALPGNEILLVDEQRHPVKDGAVGELYVKNAQLVAGYHNDDAATKKSMLAGFFSVGDLARRDGDGRYFIEGRKRDMIITGGVNVYPAEVEAVLEEHPDVFEGAVVGVPDPEWGERVKAFVVARPGRALDAEQLKQFLRARLAGPKVPREYAILSALPRNPTGKVLKEQLRARD